MESRVNEAVNKKLSGYNCAQAVACTYSDLVGIDEETMKNLTAGFMAGMGTNESSCGALTGAAMIIGMLDKNQRNALLDTREIVSKFKEQNGTVICKELKGLEDGILKRSCQDCVKDAATFLEEIISKK